VQTVKTFRLLGSIALLATLLCGCGGGEGDDNSDPPVSGIGTAGGTVTGTSGSKVVIPANALTANVAIAITETSTGAPAMPAGVIALGPVFAFTPHGTTFSTPATITLPFTPSLLPAGATPILYKTDATQANWLVVAGAAVTGSTMSGDVSGFSFAVVGASEPAPPASFTIGGAVSGLTGSGLVLRNVTNQELLTITANGNFTFPAGHVDHDVYDIRVDTQPQAPIQLCVVASGAGTVNGANVTNILVACTTPASGSLDVDFGGGKITSTANPAKSVALQADGKSVVLGLRTLSRFNTDGTPDTTFGGAGKVTIVMNGGGVEAMEAVAVQADGKIVVGGHTSTPPSLVQDFTVQRFNPDGSLDATFGSGGKVVTDFAGREDAANALAITADGNLVLAGITIEGTDSEPEQNVAVARYKPDGNLDATFGFRGKASANLPGTVDFGYGVAVQSDGKVLVAGRTGHDGVDEPDVLLLRFNEDGTPDGSFGLSGNPLVLYPPNTWDELQDVVVTSGGTVFAGGYQRVGAVYQFTVLRMNSDGSLDENFGGGGKFTSSLLSGDNFGRALVVQNTSKVLIAGQVSSLSNGNFGVFRLTSTGVADLTFGDQGLVTIDFFGGTDGARDLAVQSDGKILVVGSAVNGPAKLALARINP